MKILSIGRGDDCDIVIDDSLNQISRRHATLRLYPLGKMEIIPEGRNGTFKNGLMLKAGKVHKVTRKDVISFAHVKQLNWKTVPDVYRKWRIAVLAALATLILLFAGLSIYDNFHANPSIDGGGGRGYFEMPDTTKTTTSPATSVVTEDGPTKAKDKSNQFPKAKKKKESKIQPKQPDSQANKEKEVEQAPVNQQIF